MDTSPVLCHRCGRELHPGSGDFFVVRVEAFADPSPPILTPDELSEQPARAIERLVGEMENLSAQEAMDQVYRRLSFELCNPCFRRWIEDPTRE